MPLNCRRARRVQNAMMLRQILLFCASLLTAVTATAAQGKGVSDPAAELFTNEVIRTLDIRIAPEDYAKLAQYSFTRTARHEDRPDVPCTVREGDRTYTNVAIHVKGGLGSFRPLDDEDVSLTLNFGKFVEDQRFHGLKKLSLNSSLQDGSFVSEKLSRELYAAAGIPVTRADYAVVRLNGRKLGLRVLTEGWDKTFLKRHFANTDGNLYDNGPTGRDITDRGLQVTSGENQDDHSALTNLVRACRLTNLTERLAALEKTLDIERLLSLYAMESLCWNWDGFLLNRNNWRAYVDTASGRVTFMPHGLDQMFWKIDGPIVPQPKCLAARALIEIPEMRARLVARVRELRQTVVDPELLADRAVQISARLGPALNADGRGQQQTARLNMFLMRLKNRLVDLDRQLREFTGPLAVDTNWLRLADVRAPWRERIERNGAVESNSRDGLTNLYRVRVTGPAGLVLASKKVWLEAGRYTLEGRVKTASLAPVNRADAWQGAGLSAWCERKTTLGTSWGWFPYNASREMERRGELVPTNAAPPRLTSDRDWETLSLDFELRAPLADVELRCIVQRATGEAWFDLDSMRLRRRLGKDEEP